MVCQACFIFLLQSSFLLQSNFLLIYASNASFREASKISSPFSICSSVMVSGARKRTTLPAVPQFSRRRPFWIAFWISLAVSSVAALLFLCLLQARYRSLPQGLVHHRSPDILLKLFVAFLTVSPICLAFPA